MIARPEGQDSMERQASAAGADDVELNASRPRVLVIEDNPHDWEIYGKILWYNGFDVVYARDGEEGLRLAREQRPDLVLLDLGLPDVEGLDVCRALSREWNPPPVLVLSARPRREFETPASEAGCTRYLEKPIGPTEVLKEVEALVGRPPKPGEGIPPKLTTEQP